MVRRRIALTRASSSRGLNGFGQIVVGAQIEPDDAIDVVAARRQHQHGRLRAGLAQLLQHVEARQPRQHDVENDEVVVLALRAAQALDARRHAGELDALRGEVLDEHLGQAHVVVDDEQAMIGHGNYSLVRLQIATNSRRGP